MSRPHPYADAPTLPGGGSVDVRTLVRGAFIEIEVGPGRGGFLLERAQVVPDAGLVGLEVRRKWATIVDARLAKQGLSARARVFAEDARLALPRLGPGGSVRRIFLSFPDPWWKKRHEKRLVLEPSVADEVVRLLEVGGELFVQTDVSDRAQQYEDLLLCRRELEPAGDEPGSARLGDNPYQARSPRERRAIADGLPVNRLRFRRR
jgi:tRNA (guanine-N7-)-methyltransferase